MFFGLNQVPQIAIQIFKFCAITRQVVVGLSGKAPAVVHIQKTVTYIQLIHYRLYEAVGLHSANYTAVIILSDGSATTRTFIKK